MYSDNINDDAKLVRFLDLNGAKKSIGTEGPDYSIDCTFHYGLLTGYTKIETSASDSEETRRFIDGKLSDTTANEALLSCWSIWENDCNDNPWDSFNGHSIASDPKNVCAIVSTVGCVKQIVQYTYDLNKKILCDDAFVEIILGEKPFCEPVNYNDTISKDEWIKSISSGDPIDRTKQIIFNKRTNGVENGVKKNYSAEREYRFAIILGCSHFPSEDGIIRMHVKNTILCDYALNLKCGNHYITEVYFRKNGRQELSKELQELQKIWNVMKINVAGFKGGLCSCFISAQALSGDF